jgi:hypothetical protein
MPSQNDNGDRRGPWGGGAKPGSDLEGLVRQGQDRVKQILPSGGLRPAIVLAAIALVGGYARIPWLPVTLLIRADEFCIGQHVTLHCSLDLRFRRAS